MRCDFDLIVHRLPECKETHDTADNKNSLATGSVLLPAANIALPSGRAFLLHAVFVYDYVKGGFGVRIQNDFILPDFDF